MRKLLSVSAAVLVALSVTAGSAFADDTNNDNNGGTSGSGSSSTSTSTAGTGVDGAIGSVGSTVGSVLGSSSTSSSTSTSTTTTATPTPHHHFPGGGLHGRFGDPWYPGIPYGFPQLIDGAYLPVTALGLTGVGNVDVCGYANWAALDSFAVHHWGNRWSGVRGRFGGNPAATWLALRAAARCGTTVVVPTGLPTLYNRSYLNLNAYGVTGLNAVNVCNYATWDQFDRFAEPHFGGRWGTFRNHFGSSALAWRGGWNRLRLQANCAPTVVIAPSSNNTTVVEQAPVTTIEAAPKVVQSDPAPGTDPAPVTPKTRGSVPSGSVDSGGYDAAHLR